MEVLINRIFHMKAISAIITSAIAVSLLFASCNKNVVSDCPGSQSESVRTIAVSFSTPVKSSLDGLQPKFCNGDVIKVSNGTDSPEQCTVIVDDAGNASFSTTLAGELKAVYPFGAALMSGNAIVGIKVPAVQSGEFADANIAMAAIKNAATEATFENQTALFKVTAPSGVKRFSITSLKPVEGGVARTGTAVAINTEGSDDAAKLVISVGSGETELGTCFVSLLAGVNLSDLSFDTGSELKGIPMSKITTNATAAGTIYSIGNSGWHPYITIGGKKWATMNLGATNEKEFGDYYMWGTTEVAYSRIVPPNSDVEFKTSKPESFNNTTWNPVVGFWWDNMPFTDGVLDDGNPEKCRVFTKYIREEFASVYGKDGTFFDNKTVLDIVDDAANANWGGSWHVPSIEELNALISIQDKEWDDENFGYVFRSSEKELFFPASGRGYIDFIGDLNSIGHYMSSSMYWSDPYANDMRMIRSLSLSGETVAIDNSQVRFEGVSVRAVSD